MTTVTTGVVFATQLLSKVMPDLTIVDVEGDRTAVSRAGGPEGRDLWELAPCGLPERATARDVLLALGRLGRHFESNGEPG